MRTDAQRAGFPQPSACWKQRRTVGSLRGGVNGPVRVRNVHGSRCSRLSGDSPNRFRPVARPPSSFLAVTTSDSKHAGTLANAGDLAEHHPATAERRQKSGCAQPDQGSDRIPESQHDSTRQPEHTNTSGDSPRHIGCRREMIIVEPDESTPDELSANGHGQAPAQSAWSAEVRPMAVGPVKEMLAIRDIGGPMTEFRRPAISPQRAVF